MFNNNDFDILKHESLSFTDVHVYWKIDGKLGFIKQTYWSRSFYLLINNSGLIFYTYFSIFIYAGNSEGTLLYLVWQHIDQLMGSKNRENGYKILPCGLIKLTLIMMILNCNWWSEEQKMDNR